MSSRPIDVAGAFARWHKRVILDLASPAPEGAAEADDIDNAEAVARAVFIETVTKALADLMRAEHEESAIVFAACGLMDLVGAVVGTMHDKMCPPCVEGTLNSPIKAFMHGFTAEAKRNAAAEPARAEALQ